jgi:hypothetical protein
MEIKEIEPVLSCVILENLKKNSRDLQTHQLKINARAKHL